MSDYVGDGDVVDGGTPSAQVREKLILGRDNNGDDDVRRHQLKSPRQVYIYHVLRHVSLVKLECFIVLSVSATDCLSLRTSERYAVV